MIFWGFVASLHFEMFVLTVFRQFNVLIVWKGPKNVQNDSKKAKNSQGKGIVSKSYFEAVKIRMPCLTTKLD